MVDVVIGHSAVEGPHRSASAPGREVKNLDFTA